MGGCESCVMRTEQEGAVLSLDGAFENQGPLKSARHESESREHELRIDTEDTFETVERCKGLMSGLLDNVTSVGGTVPNSTVPSGLNTPAVGHSPPRMPAALATPKPTNVATKTTRAEGAMQVKIHKTDSNYSKRYGVIDNGCLTIYEDKEAFAAGDYLNRFTLGEHDTDVVPLNAQKAFTIWQGSQSMVTCKEVSATFATTSDSRPKLSVWLRAVMHQQETSKFDRLSVPRGASAARGLGC